MVPHPFGHIAIILIQQVLIAGLVWLVMHLLSRSRRERRRYYSSMLLSNAAATNDLAALAAQLSKPCDGIADPVSQRTRVRLAQGERA